MNKIIPLEIRFLFEGNEKCIYPTILQDNENLTLIDCAYPGMLMNIRNAMKMNGLDFDMLTAIFITHHDYDHIGSLAEILEVRPQITVYASAIQAPYIRKDKPSLRLQQAQQLHDSLPESEKEGSLKIQQLFGSVSKGRVDLTVKSGEILPWCGGTEVVDTGGHMPGHLSLYIPAFKTLIAGDALAAEEGKLQIANPQYTLDMELARQSVRKLIDYDIEKILCYHGGLCEGDIKQQLLKM